jgi:hypothetical protein
MPKDLDQSDYEADGERMNQELGLGPYDNTNAADAYNAHQDSAFQYETHGGRMEGPTSVTASEAFLMLQRYSELAARTALGDGLDREDVALALETLAAAIRTEDCAEDMSPITIHMA